MSNYNTELDMETANAPATILKSIRPNSRILEFGCAHGKMTKYLKETLNCDVSIIEINEEAGTEAIKYAKDGLIGILEGNITNFYWANKYQQEFDYIIFADILEHLINPKLVLQEATKLLKDDGSILISVPNIAYNGIILSLLQERWNYLEEGLLDKTHIYFFSYFSLKQMMKECSLAVQEEHNLINEIQNSEFKGTYDDVPQDILNLLKARVYGEVYQFVWELKKKTYDISICIPVFNKFNFTKGTLEDLAKLDNTKIEIIVCNNGSTDETKSKLNELEERMDNLFVIHNETNLGFGAACNKCFEKSSGKYIVFLNNDIRVKDKFNNWVDDLIEACDDNSLVGPTGGLVDLEDGFNFKYEVEDNSKPINYMSAWCLAAKRSLWDKLILPREIGPFDATSYFVFFEDTDLGFRASQLKINFKLTPIPVVHFKHQTAKSLNVSSLYQNARKVFLNKWKNKLISH